MGVREAICQHYYIEGRQEASEGQELAEIAAEDLLFLPRWNRQGIDARDRLLGVPLSVLAGVRRVRPEQDMLRAVERAAGQHAANGPLDDYIDVEDAVVVQERLLELRHVPRVGPYSLLEEGEGGASVMRDV